MNEMNLDHVVINVKDDMDVAQSVFSKLGFTTTPRGYHTLGSINHLMMFGTDYMELIGFPKNGVVNNPDARPDLTTAPFGINGLVFKSNDVDKTFEKLVALQMDGDPPKSFSRPVEIDGHKLDAKFRTVTARAGVFPEGRVYFCEHGTPDLVWRPEWQSHENGINAVSEIVVVARDPASSSESYSKLLDASIVNKASLGLSIEIPGGGCITVCAENQYRERYGDLASDLGGREALFGALVFNTDKNILKQKIRESEHFELKTKETSLVVRVPKYDAVLELTNSFA